MRLLLISLALAGPVFAQSTTAPAPPAAAPAQGAEMAPPPEFIQSAQGFGQCIGKNTAQVPTTVTPEAAAKQALTACATEKAAMEGRFDAWVATPSFPEAGRATAREQFRTQLGAAEVEIANKIRAARVAASMPKPAPAPR